MEIRKATIKDLKEIQDLNFALFEKEYVEFDKTLDCEWPFSKEGENYFKKRIKDNKNSYVYVAVHNEKVVGYKIGSIKKSESHRNIGIFAEGENMYILEEHRGKGIGSKFLKGFIEWGKSKKVKRIELTASARNYLAIKLYKRLGFEESNLTLGIDI